jgi:2-C-methyl-D-erythritol 4-phosphate cytidylyltransferase
MDEYAVIVAGGSGSRMHSKLPKQFIEIGGLPILMHTINQFKNYSSNLKIILVLPDYQIDTWKILCAKFKFDDSKIVVVSGGATRFQSCKNGILALKSDEAIVAIHDGVRPFVSNEIIKKGYELAYETGTAVCCVVSKDSARYVESFTNYALDRNRLKLIQTPQIFELKILKKAYSVIENETFTDDASVVESAGFPINLYDGDYKNIKITTQEDLYLAEIFLKN